MKKIVSIILLVVIITAMCVGLTACNSDDCTASTLPGIYGIEYAVNKNSDGTETNYGAMYEYYLIIINKDLTAQIRSKLVGQEEKSYSVTLEIVYDTEDTEQIDSVYIRDAVLPNEINIDANGNQTVIENTLLAQEKSFEFKNSLFGKKYLIIKNRSIRKSDSGDLKLQGLKIKYKKLYRGTGDYNQKRAIKKQTKAIDDRASDTEEDDD